MRMQVIDGKIINGLNILIEIENSFDDGDDGGKEDNFDGFGFLGGDVCVCVHVQPQSCQLSVSPWIIVCRAPQRSVGSSRWEYWSEVARPFSRESLDPAIKPMCPAPVGGFFTTELAEKPACKDSIGSLRRNWKYEEKRSHSQAGINIKC